MKITIEEYIAGSADPDVVMALLKKYSIPEAKDWKDLIKKLRYLILKHEGDVLSQLKDMETPYKNLILHNIDTEIKSNSCGCSGFDGDLAKCQGCKGCASSKEKTAQIEGGTEVLAPSGAGLKQEIVATTDKVVTDFNKYAPIATALLLAGILIAVVAKN